MHTRASVTCPELTAHGVFGSHKIYFKSNHMGCLILIENIIYRLMTKNFKILDLFAR
jgi:hypothetical protein